MQAHYDLPNQAFSLFLDPSMTYSCALFKDPNDPVESLEEAQRNKLRQVARKAGIKPGDRILEIGCGWGSLSVLAAQELECRVTALTLSQQQYDYVCELVERLGLKNRVEPVFGDYHEHTSMVISSLEDIGKNYVPTLQAWRARFHENWSKIGSLRFDRHFKRTFRYYLSICEAPFRFGHTRDLQIALDRLRHRQPRLESS